MALKVKDKRKAKDREYGGQHKAVAEGKTWTYLFKIDNDVAKKVLDELDNSETGGDIRVILNNRLRKAYKIKKK